MGSSGQKTKGLLTPICQAYKNQLCASWVPRRASVYLPPSSAGRKSNLCRTTRILVYSPLETMLDAGTTKPRRGLKWKVLRKLSYRVF